MTWAGGFPRAVQTDVAVAGDTPAERAVAYLTRYAGLYGQHDPDPFEAPEEGASRAGLPSEAVARERRLRALRRGTGQPVSSPYLKLEVVQTARPLDDLVMVRQTYRGLRVAGAELLVGVRGNRVTMTAGALSSDIDVDVAPKIPQADAEDTASGGDPVLGATHLVVADPAVLSIDTTAPRLAWSVVVDGDDPRTVLIDARNGDVLRTVEHHNDAPAITAYDAAAKRVNGTCHADNADRVFIGTEAGVFPEFASDRDSAVSVDSSIAVDRMFRTRYGRDGIDGLGGPTVHYVNAAMKDSPNAHWVADCQITEYTPGVVSLDVYGHEFAHGVIDHGLWGGPDYIGASGAIDESHSDTMGAAADGNWEVGEDLPAFGGPGTRLRNMAGPDTDRRSEFELRDDDDDHGGVHSNSGIGNFAAYLLAEGGTHPDTLITVPGIGRDPMFWVRYMAGQSTLPNVDYEGFRGLEVFYADSAWGTNGACRVKTAWAAVEYGNADANCDGTEDDPPDFDGVPSAEDNCPFVFNPDQSNIDVSDGDGGFGHGGDACDEDRDGDRVRDPGFGGTDNCPNVRNTDQADGDGDGVGAVCDPDEADGDGDGIPTFQDNCVEVSNPAQEDRNSDGIGDDCDPDLDDDGIPTSEDNAPFTPNPDQGDSDGDGLGDTIDKCPDTFEAGISWTAGNPALGVLPKPIQPDSDGDGTPDACDDRIAVSRGLPGPPPGGETPGVVLPAGRPLTIPIVTADGPFDEDALATIAFEGMPGTIGVRVVDQDGRTAGVARPDGTDSVVSFRPVGGRDYDVVLTSPDDTTVSGTAVGVLDAEPRSWPTAPKLPPNQPPTLVFTKIKDSAWGAGVWFETLGTFDPDGAIARWVLNPGDGSPPIGNTGAPPKPTLFNYQRAGTFFASMTVTDDLGATTTKLASVKVTRRPTLIAADPVALKLRLGELTPTLRFSARLTDATALGDAVGDRTIVFRTRSGGTELCRAVTDAKGTASCPLLRRLLPALLSGGYRAEFAGDDLYEPSSDDGEVVGAG